MGITANGAKEVFTVIQKIVNGVINKYVPSEGEHAEENGLFLSMTNYPLYGWELHTVHISN